MAAHLFRLIAIVWMAQAINWAGDSVWGQAAFCFAAGLGCYALGERFDTRCKEAHG